MVVVHEDEHVAVHDLALVLRAQLGGQLARAAPEHPGQLLAGEVDQAAGDDLAVRPDELDRVAGQEITADARDAGGEQGRLARRERADGPGVEGEAAAALRGVGQPHEAARAPVVDRREDGAGAADQRPPGAGRVGEEHRDARARGDLGGLHLRRHAAGADAGGAGAVGVDREGVDVGDVADAFGVGLVGVARVEGVDVGEHDERVGAHHLGDERGEPVVVAEADLAGGDGVVLVDDRDRTHAQQRAQRAGGVAVAGLTGDVLDGEQELAGEQPARREELGVALHEQALADGRGRLLVGEVAGSPGQTERAHAGGDGAGTHEDDVAAGVVGVGQGPHEPGEPHRVHPVLGAGDRRGADLDDDAAGVGNGGAQLRLVLAPGDGRARLSHRPAPSRTARRGRGRPRPTRPRPRRRRRRRPRRGSRRAVRRAPGASRRRGRTP